MTERFDALVIGAGQAGPALAARLAGAGRSVAVVERRHMGGTCVNTGCTPTKAWVASARAAHVARRCGALGVEVGGPVRVDLAAVKRRKDELVLQSRHGLRDGLEGLDGCTVIDGHARFTDAKTVDVDGRMLQAEQVFVNTGARPAIPDWPGLDAVPYLTNETILEPEEVPEHLVIVGGSYVGLEV
ncbi:MAG: FAD-dependent oxidoreductase, partial [Pseudomonadota bacterium]